MTERNYIVVSSLQRLRASLALLRESRPQSVSPHLEAAWRVAIGQVEWLISELESEVESARLEGPPEVTP